MKVKTPNFKFYIFSLTFALIFSACNKKEQLQSLNYLNNPEVGDVYFVDYGNNRYSTIMINYVFSDSISFVHNEIFINPDRFAQESISHIKNVRVEETNNPKFYKDSIIKYSNKELLKQFNDQRIYKIKRASDTKP